MTSLTASTPALLTREQVGLRLELTPQSVDGLVRSGELSPVQVSTGGERRFWPDEIMAYALHASIGHDPDSSPPWIDRQAVRRMAETRRPLVASARRVELARNGRKSRHPAWPPFTGPTERRVPAYIAFADRDHLVTYLRHRAEAELD
jgi:hypothetical protein